MRNLMVLAALMATLLLSGACTPETDSLQEIAERRAAEQTTGAERQSRLDELMGLMIEDLATIRSTTNRKEREALMASQHEYMREAMALMRDMSGMNMRDVMAEHRGLLGPKSEVTDDGSQRVPKRTPPRPRAESSDAQRLTDLENRLDMMQVMMESMMEADAK